MTGITVYGCEHDEAALFHELAPRYGVRPVVTGLPASTANADLSQGNRCISVGHKAEIAGSTLLALSRAGVRYISTRSVGYDHIDVDHAESLGISVGNVDYSPDGVADYTVMLLLMVVRDARSVISRADVQDYRLNPTRGRDLRDLVVGVVGTGRIGSAVIERLRGFGCQVLTHGRRVGAGTGHVSLDEVLRRSDVVTLHTPLDPETYHLLDAERIGRMKQGAIIVNTGRGGLVDTKALVAALEAGRLGGAALDVLEDEKGIFYADHSAGTAGSDLLSRLHRLPNVLISPHTAYYTERALSDTVEHSIVNCLKFESEEEWTG
ncbi:NAD(P)-dependent oxidoreductase [Myceligenerans pegani]|uniref:Lactate dehydrogenase n=1 Tax=Myceligenerans pegani TaxID=2776917 RepID=A0ABR9N541_9MICO|nr:NAD(P)-dependent oxidoreductase [Myceligenerans sp. TRM 65318]MBE1878791.1 lactate dehydrogenase [Myceligenerans sp. TRM 65318]MBE3021062.1 lactate dehydrogenase [Myceligenerans sp. TRM 65318]